MISFLILASFCLGFIVGVVERKVDRLVVKNPLKKPGTQSEILSTPTAQEVKKAEDREFNRRNV